jgi:hypothetical protein
MRIFAACAGALVLLLAEGARAQAPSPPVEAFGALPAIADVAISPDGSKVAFATAADGAPLVTILDVEQNRTIYRARINEGSELRDIGFADDRYVTYVVTRTLRPDEVLPSNWSFRGAPRRVLYSRNGVLDLQTSQSRLLSSARRTEQWQDQGSILVAPIAGDEGYGRLLGYAYIDGGRPRGAVFRTALDSGRSSEIDVAGANPDTLGFVLDERGAARVRIDSDRQTNRWRLFVYDNGQPRLLREGVSETGAPIAVAGALPDGRLVLIDDEGPFNRLSAVARHRRTKHSR